MTPRVFTTPTGLRRHPPRLPKQRHSTRRERLSGWPIPPISSSGAASATTKPATRTARDGQSRDPAKGGDWLAGYDRAAAETVKQIILAFREGGRVPASAKPPNVSPAAGITARLIEAARNVGRHYGAKEKSREA
jgi:hypothetical protein